MILSLVCTFASFGIVQIYLSSGHGFPTHRLLIGTLAVLAISQLAAQLIFFLHVGKEQKFWNSAVLALALLLALFLVGGSLWIMANLQHPDIPFEKTISPQHEM
jgi:cytochrome o ubiquinol oxidase operon protein cyoD